MQLLHIASYLLVVFVAFAGKFEVHNDDVLAVAHYAVRAYATYGTVIGTVQDAAFIEHLIASRKPFGCLWLCKGTVYDTFYLVSFSYPDDTFTYHARYGFGRIVYRAYHGKQRVQQETTVEVSVGGGTFFLCLGYEPFGLV